MIRIRLAENNCPENIQRVLGSYLQKRLVTVRYAGEQVTRATNKGCVQGSIGGPILWDLLLDPLLHELEKRGTYCQAYADDVVLLFDGETGLAIERQANATLAFIQAWGVRNKLRFAPHKTCAMTITRKLKYDNPRLSMGGVDIGMSSEVKILGLTIDRALTFNAHAKNVCAKALTVYKQLARAAKVSWGLHPEVIRSVYTAVVEPIIMYAASAWAPATAKLGVRKQLGIVQRGFAQKLCKAYRTVSLNASIVLAGILPLDLRIQEAKALYEAKRGVALPILADREVERRVAFTHTPHPAKHMDLGFLCLVDQTEVNDHCTQAVRIFTDGSKIEGKVGASLSLWNNDVETRNRKLKLPSYCTVYQAELLAICRATEEILASPEDSFGIYSDSRSALQTVTNWSSTHHLAVTARKNLMESMAMGKGVSLFWVKAHAEVKENDRADALAKAAARTLKVKPHYDRCPVSFVKRMIRMGTLDEWNRRFRDEPTASVTKFFFPNTECAYKTIRRVGITSLTTQIFTGHGGFSEYLNRFKLKEDPSCVCEPGVPETPLHIVFECPLFAVERNNAEITLRTEIKKENVQELLSKKLLEGFMSFATKIARKAVKRNGATSKAIDI
ncbi:hypothetical protein K1T71_001645 [Dendrolimus kikuchii]|uniref:Uncharacterized protein n=1 Tax=Dendrolimus kikuchii TaxID=765133 RepID=A0ACC1DEJ1_9NEOP|nr:hypothetical protein K1T71_001645 [Dendrolimus kikuchii]